MKNPNDKMKSPWLLLLVLSCSFLDWTSATENLQCDTNDPDLFQCADGQKCIPISKRCDFSPDCLDGSDEPPDCPKVTCQAKHFTCEKSKKCIPQE